MTPEEFKFLAFVLQMGQTYVSSIPGSEVSSANRSKKPYAVAEKIIADAVASGLGLSAGDFKDETKFVHQFRSFMADLTDPSGCSRSTCGYEHPGANFIDAWGSLYSSCLMTVLKWGGRYTYQGITVEVAALVTVAPVVPKAASSGGGSGSPTSPASA